MELSESPLDVLSRAATMVQDGLPINSDDAIKKRNTKQLTSNKWKRERRSRLPEYTRKSDPKLPENLPAELLVMNNGNSNNNDSAGDTSSSTSTSPVDTPLDMSIRQRGLPPSYSQAISQSAEYRSSFRPSVIINDNDKRNNTKINETTSISMCDPIIDEHFRRSLGKDYAMLFSNNNNSPTTEMTTTAKLVNSVKLNKAVLKDNDNSDESDNNGVLASFKEMMDTDSASLSVDDHFAKALGDTWIQINNKLKKQTQNGSNAASTTTTINNTTSTTNTKINKNDKTSKLKVLTA